MKFVQINNCSGQYFTTNRLTFIGKPYVCSKLLFSLRTVWYMFEMKIAKVGLSDGQVFFKDRKTWSGSYEWDNRIIIFTIGALDLDMTNVTIWIKGFELNTLIRFWNMGLIGTYRYFCIAKFEKAMYTYGLKSFWYPRLFNIGHYLVVSNYLNSLQT